MKIIAVVNQKGGVAKTTTCANLGAALAIRGKKVLLIDLDPQANLTMGLGVEWYHLEKAIHSTLLDPDQAPIASIVHQIDEINLFLAPGHLDLAKCERLLLPAPGREYRLRNALEAVDGVYDYVFIDCPPSLGTLTTNGIVGSSDLLIPIEPKFYAFAGMSTLNEMIADLAKSLRIHVDLFGVLLTMYERNTRLHGMVAEEIRERFGGKVFRTIIYKNVKLSEAEGEGKPIVLYDPRAPAAQNYMELAEEILANGRQNTVT